MEIKIYGGAELLREVKQKVNVLDVIPNIEELMKIKEALKKESLCLQIFDHIILTRTG